MKYNRKKPGYIDYSKMQPCWICKNACGGCRWSREGKPIDGWQAVETFIADNVGHEKSYKIMFCPEYIKD